MSNIIILFEVTVKSGKKEDLANAEGFIRSERFSFLSTFAAHRMAQKHGRMNDFADYKITVVTPVRSYTMNDRAAAPADSNAFLEV